MRTLRLALVDFVAALQLQLRMENVSVELRVRVGSLDFEV